MTRLELPWPPTTNNAYATVRGRRVKSQAARQYAADVQGELMVSRDAQELKRRATRSTRFAVIVRAHPPDRRRRDLGNLEKLPVDAIFDWLGVDDSSIDQLSITRAGAEKPGRVVVWVGPAGEAA